MGNLPQPETCFVEFRRRTRPTVVFINVHSFPIVWLTDNLHAQQILLEETKSP